MNINQRMASSHNLIVPSLPLPASSFCSLPSSSTSLLPFPQSRRLRSFKSGGAFKAMVQGAPATYAKQMERLSAKESLLLAFKDSGGFESLVTGRTSDIQRIDVNERIIGLERLNPTPRPTTSPYLEGRWNFEWFGAGSPGLFAARFIFERFPSTLANLRKMDVMWKDGYAKTTASMKLLNSIESKFILASKLSVEGPLRMKEEYVEGILESPKVDEESVPEQLRGAFGQAATTVQQLPVPVRDVMGAGLTIPLGGTFQRMFMISYLDEEILAERMTAHDPVGKEMATERKEKKISQAEQEKQEVRLHNAAARQAASVGGGGHQMGTYTHSTTGAQGHPTGTHQMSALPGHGTGQPTGQVVEGTAASHPMGAGGTTGHNTHVAGKQGGGYGTGGTH